jgi:acyl carrier protein
MVFDDVSLVIDATTTASDVDGWDSLTHVNLIYAVEREFGIKFSTAEVQGMSNVGDFIDLIAKKTKAT